MPTHGNILQHTHTVTHTDPSGDHTHLIDFPCTCTPVRMLIRDAHRCKGGSHSTHCNTLLYTSELHSHIQGRPVILWTVFCGLLIDPCVIRLVALWGITHSHRCKG